MNRIFVAALKEETPNLDYFFHTGVGKINASYNLIKFCLLYTSPSPRDMRRSRMPSSA